MFLITVKQQRVGALHLPCPTRRQRAMDLKQLADWCHTFIRSCAMMGWTRTDVHPDGSLKHLVDFRSDFHEIGIHNFMVMRREGVEKAITIEIEEIPDQPASVIAQQIAR